MEPHCLEVSLNKHFHHLDMTESEKIGNRAYKQYGLKPRLLTTRQHGCITDHHLSCLMTKPTKWLRPAKTQISLGICPVWSHPPSLIRVFAVRSMVSLETKPSSCGQRRLLLSLGAHAILLVLSWCGPLNANIYAFENIFISFLCNWNRIKSV